MWVGSRRKYWQIDWGWEVILNRFFKAYLFYVMCMDVFICMCECAPVSECNAHRGWKRASGPLEHARLVHNDHCILHHGQWRNQFVGITLKSKRSNMRCRDGLPHSPCFQNLRHLHGAEAALKGSNLRINGSGPQHAGIGTRRGQPQRQPSWKCIFGSEELPYETMWSWAQRLPRITASSFK